MTNFDIVLEKLRLFGRKYYLSKLLKGLFLFVALGLLYFILTLVVEYMLWLSAAGRTFLFWSFVIVEFALLVFLVFPSLGKLLRLQNGLDNKQASMLIGKFFPEVGDKLTNLLDLAGKEKSDLLVAGIEQKAEKIKLVPFNTAINLQASLYYLRYSLIPLLLVFLFWISGTLGDLGNSYSRVVNYDLAYAPPAPFTFNILNEELKAIQGSPFILEILISGNEIPEECVIEFEGQRFYLRRRGTGIFSHKWNHPERNVDFRLSAAGFQSKDYTLAVRTVPRLSELIMRLNYPRYTGRTDEIIKGSGNARVPDGTRIRWEIRASNTTEVEFVEDTGNEMFESLNREVFSFNKALFKPLKYEIRTHNDEFKAFDVLEYAVEVIKDEYPKLKILEERDSLLTGEILYSGELSDDYGLKEFRLVYYQSEELGDTLELDLGLRNTAYEKFKYQFPGGLNLKEGANYNYFFKVSDNDALRGGKWTSSEVFGYRKMTLQEEQHQLIENQVNTLDHLQHLLQEKARDQNRLNELVKEQNEKKDWSYKDRRKLDNFLKRQKAQDELMKQFNEKLKDNINKVDSEEHDKEFKKLLQERLKRQEEQLEKNKKLLDQLEELAKKMSKEELKAKLEQMGKNQKSNERSLEQLLELTKKYYVHAKADKIKKELDVLAKEQSKLGLEQKIGESGSQKKLNEAFEKLSKDMQDLRKENDKLRKPVKMGLSRSKEEGVKDDQKQALEKLGGLKNDMQSPQEETNGSGEKKDGKHNIDESEPDAKGADKHQKNAARKMKQMAKMMGSSAAGGGGGDSEREDAEMLRQILDNLVYYSFRQEELMKKMDKGESNNVILSRRLKEQQDLKQLFEHVDDSLFALSLRQPKIAVEVNERIEEVYFNIDKAQNRFAEILYYQGVSYQQGAFTAANDLAEMLAGSLENMQMSLSKGKGSGGGDFQLPDIIQSQEELNEQMQQAVDKKGKGKQKGNTGEPGQEGESSGQDENGTKGKSGKGEAKDAQGQSGNGQMGEGKDGEGGKSGKNTSGQKGDKQGKNGKGGLNGEGNKGGYGQENLGEEELNEIFQIYQKQQELRQALEFQLKDKLGSGEESGLIRSLEMRMEQIENELLENGINQGILQKMRNLQHNLLKLNKASFEQGKEKKRESQANKKEYNNQIGEKEIGTPKYYRQIEILDRDDLPMRRVYKERVKDYFED